MHTLYDVLGKEVKMGPVDLPPKAREGMNVLKGKVQSAPVLVFPDFDKPFLLEMDAGSPISHSWQTVQSLLEGAIVGAANRDEAEANEGLLEEHEHMSRKARVQAAKLQPMHIVDWEQAQEVDVTLAGCRKWLHLRKGTPPPR